MTPSIETQTTPAAPAPAQLVEPRQLRAALAGPAPAVERIDPAELRKNLEEAVATLNQQMREKGRGLNFALDDRINRTIITVRSTSSGEVVRQIPDEVVIRVAHNIEDIKGLLLDEIA